MRDWAEIVQASTYTPIILMAVYVLGGFVLLPITLMILATVLTFGPWWGMAYAVCGSLLSALSSYWVGKKIGRDTVRKVSGARLNRINKALASKGLWAIVTLRVLPVAPFTVGNLAAGASQIRLRDFILGTLIGMGPGIITIAVFGSGLGVFLKNPDLRSAGIFLAVIAGAGGLFWMLRKVVIRKMDTRKSEKKKTA